MPTRPDKQSVKKSAVDQESDLLKALADLEEEAGLRKGDALENADTEGGFSTEGKPLSKSKRERLSKTTSASDMGSGEESSSDMGSEEDEPEMSKKMEDRPNYRPGIRGVTADLPKGPTAVKKSMMDNEDLQKGFEVTPFLQEFAVQMGEGVDNLGGYLADLEKSIRRDLAKSDGAAHQRYQTLAKANLAIGREVQGIREDVSQLLKGLSRVLNMPAPSQRRMQTTESDIQQPDFQKSVNTDTMSTGSLSPRTMSAWLVKKSQAQEIRPEEAIAFESTGFDIQYLPPRLRKSFATDMGLSS